MLFLRYQEVAIAQPAASKRLFLQVEVYGKLSQLLLNLVPKIALMVLQIYGIPTCGTCKKALQWLDQADIPYEFVNTKTSPPSRETISGWVSDLGAKPLRNTSGKSYRAIGPEKQTWNDSQWTEAFAQDAMLLKRPVFVKQEKAVMVGFRESEAAIKERLQ